MKQKIAVETLTLVEVSKLFQESLEIAIPKFNGAIKHKEKKIKKAKISNQKWIKTYEEFKGAKLNFYCHFISTVPSPIVSIGMAHRTTRGLILVTADTSNGGIPMNSSSRSVGWNKWVRIYTAHFCERYAQRILKSQSHTFEAGSEAIMFSDILGPARVTNTTADGVEEIEFQFTDGQAYGYRDRRSKIVYFKTVYSNDMLKGDRIAFREDWKEAINQLDELFRWV